MEDQSKAARRLAARIEAMKIAEKPHVLWDAYRAELASANSSRACARGAMVRAREYAGYLTSRPDNDHASRSLAEWLAHADKHEAEATEHDRKARDIRKQGVEARRAANTYARRGEELL